MAEFIESLKLRPLDVGGLNMAHWLEGTGLVAMGLASHGVGNYDFALVALLPAYPYPSPPNVPGGRPGPARN